MAQWKTVHGRWASMVRQSADAAIEAAMKNLYSLPEKQWKKPAIEISQKWRPWRSIACWYLYKYHDFLKKGDAPN